MVCGPLGIQSNWLTMVLGVYRTAKLSTYTRTVKIGSGGVATATTGTGACTLAPLPGALISRGNPHSAAGGGSAAGGTMVRSDGGGGVIGQLATFLGSPEHPPITARMPASITVPMSRMRC